MSGGSIPTSALFTVTDFVAVRPVPDSVSVTV